MNYFWRYLTPTQFDDIILRSDGEFLTGLSFDTENIINSFKQQPVFPKHTRPKLAPPVRNSHLRRNSCQFSRKLVSGLTRILVAKHQISRQSIDSMASPHFVKKSKPCFSPSPTERPPLMAHLPTKLPQPTALKRCLREQSVTQSAGTLSASSFLVIASSAQMIKSPDTVMGSKTKSLY